MCVFRCFCVSVCMSGRACVFKWHIGAVEDYTVGRLTLKEMEVR